jgi:hypothetical protein
MTERPTYQQVSDLAKAILLDDEEGNQLVNEFPETAERLREQIAEIEERGEVVTGFDGG